MAIDETAAAAQAVRMGSALDKRIARYNELEARADGNSPVPSAISRARATTAFNMLMEFAETDYAGLIVKAASSRMAVGGFRWGDVVAERRINQVWQDNQLDAESRLGHEAAITHGRFHAIIWPSPNEGESPQITLEDSATVIVEYAEGSRHKRAAALRRWVDDDGRSYATLYRPDGVYKFQQDSSPGATGWVKRTVLGESWPLEAPGGIVPVVELSTNRKLRPGRYRYARGDFEPSTPLLDRINILEFLRLVIAFTSGFPIRALVGQKILKDDDGNDLPPFKLAADVIAQFENKDARLEQLAAGDLKGFGEAIEHDVENLAGATRTPTYYLRSVPLQNIAPETIEASDTPLNTRVDDHKLALGEGWEEVMRVAGGFIGVEVPANAETVWIDRQSRSLSQRADAAVKLAPILPPKAVQEVALGASDTDIARWDAMAADQGLLDQMRDAAAAEGV